MPNWVQPRKKLIEAGEFWATPAGHDSDEVAQLADLGLLVKAPTEFEIFEENIIAFQIFSQCSWHINAMSGQYQSLNITDLKAILELEEITETKKVYRQVRTIEQGALKQMSKKNG